MLKFVQNSLEFTNLLYSQGFVERILVCVRRPYNESCIICITLYTEIVTDQTDHFADVFVHEHVAYGYDVVTTL